MSSSTASAIVADTASGHHDLKIDGYSSTKALPCGEGIESSPFTIGGHRWIIKYYPNGLDRGGYISLALVLDEEVASPVTARVQLGFAPAKERRALCFGFHGKSKPTMLFKSGDINFGSYGKLNRLRFIRSDGLEWLSKHLRDDSFTIRCHIVVIEGFHAQEGAPAKTPAAPRVSISVPPSDLNRHLRDLLETGNGADVAFEVAGETFAAHRWLLAARSPVLGAELLGPTNQSSAGAAVVRIDKMEARVFRALLCFIYTDALPETTAAKPEEAAAMAQHLLVAAHRYGMERLKLVCEEQLCNSIDVGTAASILALAGPLGCHGLKDACFDFLSSPANLKAVMVSDGFQQLSTSCPSVVKQLISMCSSSAP